MKPITSANSYLYINLLNITQNLGETRNSRDSVRRREMVLTHNESWNKLGFSTKSNAPVFLFKSSKLKTTWNYNLNAVSDTIPQFLTHKEISTDESTGKIICLKAKELRDTVYLMKTYFWPPWPWLTNWKERTKTKMVCTHVRILSTLKAHASQISS